MDLIKAAERLMRMDEATWLRHANPWSVWTRFTCLPLLVLAVWSRQWLGWWALVLFALAAAWTWYNPRAFPPPDEFGSWASRATLGERIYLARRSHAVPRHHIRAAHVLAALSALGLPPLIYGLWAFDWWATISGVALMILPKVWFCDRMVWIHADLTGIPPGTPMPYPTLPEPAPAGSAS
ncbi:MAG: hypothetical protein KI785_05250 [Devosiaceae bacterium]|nr:hypothetical protein [Devosiaceae bacterium MH13]